MDPIIKEIEERVEKNLLDDFQLWLKDPDHEHFGNCGGFVHALSDSVQMVLEERRTEDTPFCSDQQYFLHEPLPKDYFKYSDETIEEYKKFLNYEHSEDFDPHTFRDYRECISFHRVQMFMTKMLELYTEKSD